MTRKLISLMHVSLDGFCAGPKGEMNWIAMDDTVFADVESLIGRSGAAVYGRTTYGMMRGYWPSVIADPKAPEDRRAHARWMEAAEKTTFSRTLEACDWNNCRLHRDAKDILALKAKPGKDLLIFGSPGLVHAFLEMDAIDEFWIFQNPVLLGAGIPYLKGAHKMKLKLAGHKPFENGVVRLHYVKESV